MHWLAEGMTHCESPRVFLFTFDAMTLIIVAIASAFGARAISRLRRQVAEARQLGQYRLRRRIGGGGMGEVFLAEHQLLKRPCALKLIRPARRSNRKRWRVSSAKFSSPPRFRTPTRSRSSITGGLRMEVTTTSWSTCPA